MSYKHLNFEERHYIEFSLKSGHSLKQIASYLDRAQSTVSREVKRNLGLCGYCQQTSKQATSLTERVRCFVRILASSATSTMLDTGGWLDLTRQGLSPCKMLQASLVALTPHISRPKNA